MGLTGGVRPEQRPRKEEREPCNLRGNGRYKGKKALVAAGEGSKGRGEEV